MRGQGLGVRGHNNDDRRSRTQDQFRHTATNHARLSHSQSPSSTDPVNGHHLALLSVLNSSTACFWLKQNSYDKGAGGIAEGVKAEGWERFREYTGTTIEKCPLPARPPLQRARELDLLAGELATSEPSAVARRDLPSVAALASAKS